MTSAELRLKFRQSKDYTGDMMIRDLIELTQEMNKRFAALEATSIEYGDWTPRLVFGAIDGDVGVTYVAQDGQYQRIGKLVFVQFSLRVATKGTSVGAAYIDGLPFNVQNSAYPLNFAVGHYQGLALAAGRVLGLLAINYLGGKAISLRQMYDSATAAVTDANILDNSWITASGFYEIAG